MPHFSGQSRYYSFEIPGLLHVAAIDTDAYALPDVNSPGNGHSGQSFFVGEQWNWLKKDLEAVDRQRTPWVFLMGHHPMYCSSSGEVVGDEVQASEELVLVEGPKGQKVQAFPKLACSAANIHGHKEAWEQRRADFLTQTTNWCYDCTTGAEMIKEGCTSADQWKPGNSWPSCGIGTGNWTGKRWGLEDLLDTYGVDMYFTGHIHMYERSYPTLRGKVQNYYNKPTFPVHINTGNSGNRSDFALGPERDFSAKRLVNVGCYSSVHIHNATHLTFQQKSNDDGTVLDEFVLEKERGGARS